MVSACIPPGEQFVVSRDGYIRTVPTRIASLRFVHLASACDRTLLAELKANAVPAFAAGYTEWVSETAPTVSLGWDWYWDVISNRFLLATNDVRSNVMLVDAHGYDLGMNRTAQLICMWLTQLEWQAAVRAASFPDRSQTCQG